MALAIDSAGSQPILRPTSFLHRSALGALDQVNSRPLGGELRKRNKRFIVKYLGDDRLAAPYEIRSIFPVFYAILTWRLLLLYYLLTRSEGRKDKLAGPFFAGWRLPGTRLDRGSVKRGKQNSV